MEVRELRSSGSALSRELQSWVDVTLGKDGNSQTCPSLCESRALCLQHARRLASTNPSVRGFGDVRNAFARYPGGCYIFTHILGYKVVYYNPTSGPTNGVFPKWGSYRQVCSCARRTLVRSGHDHLQAACDSASEGDELVLADGRYTGDGTFVVEVRKSITIRAQTPGQAILDGEGQRRGVHVPPGNTVSLSGLTIQNGRAGDGDGGGGLNIAGEATLNNCIIRNNTQVDIDWFQRWFLQTDL
mmetsp:Transcript_25507/g.84994  ORF Transcript_25507/g.84994 Transcript_25507/m.84994 type:complete len:243 (-) Transcript_25507:42-770(-)